MVLLADRGLSAGGIPILRFLWSARFAGQQFAGEAMFQFLDESFPAHRAAGPSVKTHGRGKVHLVAVQQVFSPSADPTGLPLGRTTRRATIDTPGSPRRRRTSTCDDCPAESRGAANPERPL